MANEPMLKFSPQARGAGDISSSGCHNDKRFLHKRVGQGRPKNRRAGCLMCKYWKMNGFGKRTRRDGERFSDHKRRRFAEMDIEQAGEGQPGESQ